MVGNVSSVMVKQRCSRLLTNADSSNRNSVVKHTRLRQEKMTVPTYYKEVKYFLETDTELPCGLEWDEYDTEEDAIKDPAASRASNATLYRIEVPGSTDSNHDWFLEHIDQAEKLLVRGEGWDA